MDKKSGFSLVELLVVISIMAIIGAIALTIFSGARQKADDGRRKSEIKSIADSIETSKNFSNRTYKYTTSDAALDFSSSGVVPDDPNGIRHYCVSTKTSADTNPYTPPEAPTNWTTATCPNAPATYTTISSSIGSGGALNSGNITSWRLCASMDKESTPFCVTSLER